MDRILSWKIDSSTYAYIYPIKNSYISNRIPEDSPLWGEIINEISVWTKDTYRANFDRMASEVKSKYGQTIPWQDAYWDFSDDNSTLPVNIVLLSGKDGDGSGYGSGQGDEIGAEIYEELRDAINKELDKAKKDIEEQNKRVEEFVEQKVGETIAEAKKTIAETEQKLAETREELETKLDGAAEALDKAAALFDLGEGNITGEQIQDALTSIDECGEWITSLSGVVTEFKTDYDAANRIMGGIGSAEDALAGLFSRFGTTLNDIDDTVGTVNSWMVASAATIGDVATWYDVNASAVTEASSIINASAGTITDAINFISGDGLTTRITSEMNAVSGTIKDEIMTQTSAAVTNVKNEMNGLSGVVATSITRLNSVDGSLSSLGSRMSAAENSLEEWITVAAESMSAATDLRETWTIESGKLSTVANLTAETDIDGNIMYYVSGGVATRETRVYLGNDGKWRDADGTEYNKEDVYVHWSQDIGSYIQQQASSITMSVMNSSGLTAAIKLAIENDEDGDKSLIKLVSDKIIITGDMIGNAISANSANIGGIQMYMGEIWSTATNADGSAKFRLNGKNGTIYANDAEIKGAITASSLTLKNGEQIETYVKGQIPKDLTSQSDVKEMISAYVDSEEFKQSIVNGYITAEDLQNWAASQENLTQEQVEEMINRLAGSEVNYPLEDEPAASGGTRHSIMVGGNLLTWVTYDADQFVILDSELTGEKDGETTRFFISKDGLMEAKNAVVHGKIYANEGWFKGKVEANEGYFRGSIEADSGKIGGFVIEDETLAVSGTSGCTAVLKGGATSQDNEDLFQLGLDLSERKILYAFKASGSSMDDNNKMVSSDTTYHRIYLTQEQIQEGEEVEAYYRNNDRVSTSIGVVYGKFFPFDSAGTIVNIHPAANWWGSKNRLVKNAVKVKVKVSGGGWGQTQQGSYRIRYEYYVRDASGDYDFNGLQCAASGLPIYNTRITSNGIVYCETLNAKDGMYCGTINSDGYFNGELNCNRGVLNNTIIKNSEFFGSTFLNCGATFCALDEKYKTYLTIFPFSVTDKTEKEYSNAEYYRYIKNSNGNNAGKRYYAGENSGDTISLVELMIPSGAVVTIPKLTLNVWRYVPTARTSMGGQFNISYTIGGSNGSLISKSIGFLPSGSETITAESAEKTLTATSNTRLTIKMSYNLHLPTYYWLGADKAAASITLKNAGDISVSPPGGISQGVVIGKDGFMVKCGTYGFRVTSSGGIEKCANNEWTDL